MVGPQGNITGYFGSSQVEYKWFHKAGLRVPQLFYPLDKWVPTSFQLGWSSVLKINPLPKAASKACTGKKPSSQWCWDPAQELRAPRREKRGACRTCHRALASWNSCSLPRGWMAETMGNHGGKNNDSWTCYQNMALIDTIIVEFLWFSCIYRSCYSMKPILDLETQWEVQQGFPSLWPPLPMIMSPRKEGNQ